MSRGKLAPALVFLVFAAGAAVFSSRSLPDRWSDKTLPSGLWVEKVYGTSVAEQGPQPGDRLLSWHLEVHGVPVAHGHFERPEDWFRLTVEEMPRGETTVELLSGVRRRQWKVPAEPPALALRPALSATDEESFRRGARVAESDLLAALAVWGPLAESWLAADRPADAAWLAGQAADAAFDARQLDLAAEWHNRACRWADLSGREMLRLLTRFASLQTLLLSDRLAETESRLDDIDRLLSHRGEESLLAAEVLSWRSSLLLRQGQIEASFAALEKVLELQQRLAPDSLLLAQHQVQLAEKLARRGDFHRALGLLAEAWRICRARASESMLAAHVLHRQGTVLWLAGDLVSGEEQLAASLAMKERLAPESGQLIPTLNNLGGLAMQRGRMAEAERLLVRALTLREKFSMGSADGAYMLSNLGALAFERGDVAAARDYLERAIAAFEAGAAGNVAAATAWYQLGRVERSAGLKQAARAHFERTLELEQRVSSKSLNLGTTLLQLGGMALDEGDLVAAKGLLNRAHEVFSVEGRGSGTLEEVDLWVLEARLAEREGRLAEAERLHRDALAVRSAKLPQSALEASSAYDLGRLLRRQGRTEEAQALFVRMVASIEAQVRVAGGLDIQRYQFAARFAAQYGELIDLLAEQGRSDDAFALLERSRARTFLALLAERELSFERDLPEGLERERKRLEAEYDALLSSRLRSSAVADSPESFDQKLRRVRQRQLDIAARIRALEPRLAGLQDPRPLDAAAAGAQLEPGTLLLSYAVGEERSWLFVLPAGAAVPRLVALPWSRAMLSERVSRLRQALAERAPFELTETLSRELSDALLLPAAPEIAAAERLAVVPDGPLHALPFAVLLDPAPTDERQFIVRSKALYKVASATVLAELKARPRHPSGRRVTAFGDPVYGSRIQLARSQAPAGRAHTRRDPLRSVLARGFSLEPLPSTREEVEGLRRLFAEVAKVFLGEEATEERAKSLTREDSLVHFACHGYVDAHSPLESGLVLSLPTSETTGGENGVLQAWEILEELRLDADLVTLSACETGLGTDFGGEGIVGLTRAFQHAGARSVLSSLWRVGDEPTARLMAGFYRRLKDGSPKAEALRAAQLDMLSSHPNDWAGFELVGEWR